MAAEGAGTTIENRRHCDLGRVTDSVTGPEYRQWRLRVSSDCCCSPPTTKAQPGLSSDALFDPLTRLVCFVRRARLAVDNGR